MPLPPLPSISVGNVNTTLSFVNYDRIDVGLHFMVRIEWAHICEMAFLGDCDRLCMIGSMTRFPAPQLPIAMRQVVIVVRINDVQNDETFGIGVSMVTPCGRSLTPPRPDGVDIAMTPEYIFLT